MLAGYARLQDTEAALGTLQAFVGAGGAPDSRMFDTLVDLCVRTGEFKRAMQVPKNPKPKKHPMMLRCQCPRRTER